MHQINDAIVRGGKLELSDLPFADGQRVRILVTQIESPAVNRISIHEVRRLLNGGVERFDDPFEPMIPTEHWGMLK
jgi:hypothetical protein